MISRAPFTIASAVQDLAKANDKLIFFSAAGSSDLSGKSRNADGLLERFPSRLNRRGIPESGLI